jgi:HD-like signal output (HDOD) protein
MIKDGIKIHEIISKVEEFPTLPTIYSTMLDLMANPRSTAKDVADLISKDQSAAAKILKAANSPIYGFYGRINTITQAIIFLGFDEVKNLVTALSIIDLFNKEFSSNKFNPVDFWKHSISVGIITRMIGKTIGVSDLENYFLGGILHDLGKLLFLKILPAEYSKVTEYAVENRLQIREAELKFFGITHTVAGEILAEKWRLPVCIRQAIRYHTTGYVDGDFNQLVSSVHIANITSSAFGLGYNWEHIIPVPNIEVWEKLSLHDSFFSSIINTLYYDYYDSVNILLKH